MTMTQDERISRLEGAFEALSIMVANMVTKDELRAELNGHRMSCAIQAALDGHKEAIQAALDGHKEATQAATEGLRGEMVAAINGLRAETIAAIAGLRSEMLASDQSLRNEMEAKLRASELRLVRWMIATAFAGATLIIGSISAIMFTAIRLMT